MACNLKSIGLALIAVLAMSALAASAAQAVPEFTASAYPATATGSNMAGNETLTTPGGTVQCSSHYLVEEYGGGEFTGPTPTLTIKPSYMECNAFGFLGATINTNGCTFVYHATERVSPGTYRHHIDIVCPSGQKLTITAGTCELDVPPQTGLTTATTMNLVSGQETVQPNITGITMNVTKDGFGCPFAGTGHIQTSYHGDIVVSRVGGGAISVSGE